MSGTRMFLPVTLSKTILVYERGLSTSPGLQVVVRQVVYKV